jgi:hypothetical protein
MLPFYIYKVTLQPILYNVIEECFTGYCDDSSVAIDVSGNSPYCSNSTIEASIKVTFKSEESSAYFIRNFRFARKSEENQKFFRTITLYGNYGNLYNGNVYIETYAQCVKKLINL